MAFEPLPVGKFGLMAREGDMAKNKEETIEVKPEYVKRNLNSTLTQSYEKLLFLAGNAHNSGGLDEPDCMVLEPSSISLAMSIR